VAFMLPALYSPSCNFMVPYACTGFLFVQAVAPGGATFSTADFDCVMKWILALCCRLVVATLRGWRRRVWENVFMLQSAACDASGIRIIRPHGMLDASMQPRFHARPTTSNTLIFLHAGTSANAVTRWHHTPSAHKHKPPMLHSVGATCSWGHHKDTTSFTLSRACTPFTVESWQVLLAYAPLICKESASCNMMQPPCL